MNIRTLVITVINICACMKSEFKDYVPHLPVYDGGDTECMDGHHNGAELGPHSLKLNTILWHKYYTI
jgi:hypothetical protein